MFRLSRALHLCLLLSLASIAMAADWGDGEFTWPVKSDGDVFTLSTPKGAVQVDKRWKTAAPYVAPALAKVLETLEDGKTTWRLIHTPKLGVSLVGGQRLVGVGRDWKAKKSSSGVKDLKQFRRQLKALKSALPKSQLSDLGQAALGESLNRLGPKAGEFPMEEVDPWFIRHLVADGWIDDQLPGLSAAQDFTAITRKAMDVRVLGHWAGTDGSLMLIGDAFGARGQVVETDGKKLLVRPVARPFYVAESSLDALAHAQLVAELKEGSDPIKGLKLEDISAASMHASGEVLSSWDGETLNVDSKTWRAHVDIGGKDVTKNYIPPHLVLRDLDDAVLLIATTGGGLKPSDGTDSERFFADAAKVCTTAAELDLIGQYLFRYAFDSPDNRHPFLIGSNALKSDIHQTAEESLATSAGGICRGDCDDLSELYQRIVTLQGRIGHVVLLPGHAALAYAEKDGDGWAVEVLQTGPALRFSAPTLQEALGATFRKFSPTGVFDPNAIGLLLRFSGENRRSPWRLSWRIFEDAKYSETMIDVQRDWHYQTFAQAIAKMKDLIADGNDDNANYREVGGLYGFTGQYPEAVEWLDKAIERTPEAVSRFQVEIERQGFLNKYDEEAARELALRLVTTDLQAVSKDMGPGAVDMVFRIPRMLLRVEEDERAQALFRGSGWPRLAQATMQLIRLAQGNPKPEQWGAANVKQVRRIANRMAGTSMALLKDNDAEAINANNNLKEFQSLALAWWTHVAFRDAEDDDAILARYGALGQFYEIIGNKENFRKQIDAVKPPKKNRADHFKRKGFDKPQLAKDVAWVSISLQYWGGRISDTLDEETGPDREALKKLLPRAQKAYEQVQRLGMMGPQGETAWHNLQIFAAMHLEDEELLRERFRHIQAVDDKHLRDNCAVFLGRAAEYATPEWWKTVLNCWVEEIDYKAKYFMIAWQAMVVDAHDQALAAAELAVKRFPEEKAFADELRYMKELVAKAE